MSCLKRALCGLQGLVCTFPISCSVSSKSNIAVVDERPRWCSWAWVGTIWSFGGPNCSPCSSGDVNTSLGFASRGYVWTVQFFHLSHYIWYGARSSSGSSSGSSSSSMFCSSSHVSRSSSDWDCRYGSWVISWFSQVCHYSVIMYCVGVSGVSSVSSGSLRCVSLWCYPGCVMYWG